MPKPRKTLVSFDATPYKLTNSKLTQNSRGQAEQLFEILVEGRPGDLILAYEATEKKGEKFILQLIAGMKLIKPEVSETVRQITGCE